MGTTSTESHGDFFYRALVALAMIVPFLLVFATRTLPLGPERGELIVYGHEVLVVVLATALVLRAVYIRVFNRALQQSQTRSRMADITA
jgi:uncharacterized membrane protein (DUF485 family)